MSNPILDRDGVPVGYQEADGTVRDRNNKKVGQIKRDGAVINNRGEQVGTISARGDVTDRYGRQVGSISQDGTVQDWHGIPVFSGSAAPLLLEFDAVPRPEPMEERLEFDRLAREAKTPGTPRGPLSILPEGFVSPSVIGCLGIGLAVIVGLGIMAALQNPSLFSPGKATPTLAALDGATPQTTAGNATTDANAASQATATPNVVTGKVNADSLNLRKGPATSFEIVDRLPQATQVLITGRLSDSVWLKVDVPGISKDGWVAAEYIDTEADLTKLPVVPPPSQ